MIYLDNAATSFPKPAEPLERALQTYLTRGASPGRGGYDLAVEAEYMVEAVRGKLLTFFGAHPSWRVIFAQNATDALNTLILGLAKPGCHVVSTRLEHNSVLRPLNHLRSMGRISFDLVPFNRAGFVNPEDIQAALKPETAFVMLNHASNVLGTIQPVAEVGQICGDAGVPLLLDASQSAGLIPMASKDWGVKALAFTGHKSLMAPTGIGGLLFDPGLDLRPSRFGGTGSDSANPLQPLELPFRLEAGTLNLFGILALGEALDYLKEQNTDGKLLRREMELWRTLRRGLLEISGLTLLGEDGLDNQLPIMCINLPGYRPGDLGAVLDGDYDIAARSGLHCAPLAHEDLGTAPHGALRFSLGPRNKREEIETVIQAIAELAAARS